MARMPVRARITDEITGVVYIVRCERELTPQEIQRAILEYKKNTPASLRVGRGEIAEIRVPS